MKHSEFSVVFLLVACFLSELLAINEFLKKTFIHTINLVSKISRIVFHSFCFLSFIHGFRFSFRLLAIIQLWFFNATRLFHCNISFFFFYFFQIVSVDFQFSIYFLLFYEISFNIYNSRQQLKDNVSNDIYVYLFIVNFVYIDVAFFSAASSSLFVGFFAVLFSYLSYFFILFMECKCFIFYFICIQ